MGCNCRRGKSQNEKERGSCLWCVQKYARLRRVFALAKRSRPFRTDWHFIITCKCIFGILISSVSTSNNLFINGLEKKEKSLLGLGNWQLLPTVNMRNSTKHCCFIQPKLYDDVWNRGRGKCGGEPSLHGWAARAVAVSDPITARLMSDVADVHRCRF